MCLGFRMKRDGLCLAGIGVRIEWRSSGLSTGACPASMEAKTRRLCTGYGVRLEC